MYLETNVSFRYLHTTLAVQYKRLIFALQVDYVTGNPNKLHKY